MWKISTFLKPECRWGSTSITFSTASRTTLSVSLLWSAFILSLKSLKILVYLSWHMFWHTPSLLVWVLRCSIFGEEALNFLVWVETETFSMGWGIVGISWLELTASVSGSGSYRERKNLWIQILKQNKLTSSFPWGKNAIWLMPAQLMWTVSGDDFQHKWDTGSLRKTSMTAVGSLAGLFWRQEPCRQRHTSVRHTHRPRFPKRTTNTRDSAESLQIPWAY